MKRFTAMFASIPYPTDNEAIEYNFKIAIYLVFMLLGQFVKTEVHSSQGRADCIVEADERKLFMIGASFDSDSKTLEEYKYEI